MLIQAIEGITMIEKEARVHGGKPKHRTEAPREIRDGARNASAHGTRSGNQGVRRESDERIELSFSASAADPEDPLLDRPTKPAWLLPHHPPMMRRSSNR
jgi:hypothetical protein